MDILLGKIPDNYNEVRGRTVSPQPYSSRVSSMSSTKSLVNYYERMECNNNLNNDIKMNNDSEGPGLSYETVQEQAICVSIVADLSNNTLNKHVTNECPTISSPHVQTAHSTLGSLHGNDTAINIQLLYNPNTPIEPNLWDGNFLSYPKLQNMSETCLTSI